MRPANYDFLLQPNDTFASGEGPATGITDILGTLRREWKFPVFGCLIGLMLAVSYIVLVPSLYKSTARILIDRSMNQYLQTNKIIDEPTIDQSEADSQVHILSSESIVVPVVRSMNLARDSEFVGPPHALGALILWRIKKLIGSVMQSIGLNDDATIDAAVLERIAVETFLSRLNAYREDVTYVIDVTFASEDPNKAARIANAVADTYIATSLESKSKSTKIASQWLQDRLTELKVQATDADRALQNYKTANNLVNTGRGFLNYEQLSDLATQLSNARRATSEAKARLDRVQQMSSDGIPSATVTDALNNNVITNVRTQYLGLVAKAADLTSRVGPGHVAVVRLHEQMDELRKSIRNEEQRIADAYTSDYQIAKARESDLAASMAQLVGEAGTSRQAQVTMHNLESSADTYRNLYNSILQKFQETTIQTQTIPVYDARIVTRAAPPLHKNLKMAAAVLAGGMVFGLFLGAGAGISREWMADVFRTPKEVEQVTGIHCLGILPAVTANRKRTAWFLGSTKSMVTKPDATEGVEEFVLDAPYSRFAETLRNVKVLINAGQSEHGVKVIGIVSSVAKEGKTTIAANLAALMIASSGARTLIIDGDLHQRSLTAKLAPDAREGLIEALADPSRLATLVYKRQRSGLDVLPCVLENRVPNAAELLGSPQMEQLLVAARKAYDYILIELAPIMSVVDVKAIERFIDSFIFVVEWGQSKRSLIQEALLEVQIIHERLTGIILNNADPVALRSIEAYKGARYRDYYLE